MVHDMTWLAHPIFKDGHYPDDIEEWVYNRSLAQGLTEDRIPEFRAQILTSECRYHKVIINCLVMIILDINTFIQTDMSRLTGHTYHKIREQLS